MIARESSVLVVRLSPSTGSVSTTASCCRWRTRCRTCPGGWCCSTCHWAEGAAGTSTATSAVDVADEVLVEIDDHLGDEPFAVVGNSFGGMIARHVAHERRDQSSASRHWRVSCIRHTLDRAVPERTVLHAEPSVLEAAGDARAAFEEVSVIQDAAAFVAFERYVLPVSVAPTSP